MKMEIGNMEKVHTKDMKKEEYLNLRIYTLEKERFEGGKIRYRGKLNDNLQKL